MGYEIVDLLSIVFFCGFICVFILPTIFLNFAFEIPRHMIYVREGRATKKSVWRTLYETLLWIIVLVFVYTALFFVNRGLFIDVVYGPIAIFFWLLGLGFMVARTAYAWRVEWRERRIKRLETSHKLPLGMIMVDNGLITQAQLNNALLIQERERVHLGEALLRCEIIEPKELDKYLKQQNEIRMQDKKVEIKKAKLLGEILIDADIVTEVQIKNALSRQKNEGGLLGELLYEEKCIDEDVLQEMLDIQEILDASLITKKLASHLVSGILNNRDGNIGSILLYSGLIAREQLDVALKKQRFTGNKLGTILVEQGFVSQNIVDLVYGIQCIEQAARAKKDES